MKKTATAIFLVMLIAGVSRVAFADCTDPAGVEAEIIYNADQNVPQICTGTDWVALGGLNPGAGGSGCTNPAKPEGAIIYNDDIHMPQYCDGDDWRKMIGTIDGGGCTPDPACPNVGDVCADGSLFAGFVVYNNSSCEPLYVTDNNQSTSIQWKNATGTDDISTDDHVDGQVNHANRGGTLSDFPAFDLCESNTYHGKSDWYLPAHAELNLLWLNRAAINANAAGNFTTNTYWSSTEYGTSARHQNFGNGYLATSSKTTWYEVRCVRTAGQDTTPDAFSFTDQTGVATNTPISSNTINITGITGSVSVSISGDGSPDFRIDGGSWLTAGTITNGQTLQLRLTSNAANSTMNSAVVTVGTRSDQWDVTTESGAPSGCPSIGDVCSDGSVYAGLSPDGNVPMYTTPSDQAGTFCWNNCNDINNVTTSQTSLVTGATNTANLIGIDSDSGTSGTQPHQPAQSCADLDAHGHTDWYLPARNELKNVLYTNRAAIGNFTTGWYWSSSENNNTRSWSVSFSDGFELTDEKSNSNPRSRCVRKE